MKKIIGFALIASPFFAFADVQNLQGLVMQLEQLINSAIPLLFGIALLGFIWGVITYIWSAAKGNAEQIKEARKFIFFSIVAIACMLSVWSLAFFLKDSFFPNAPSLNSTSGDSNYTNAGNNLNGGSTGPIDCAHDMENPACF